MPFSPTRPWPVPPVGCASGLSGKRARSRISPSGSICTPADRARSGYHALNLALHLGAVLLAFECLRRLLPERAALVAAAIFAVHPLQAEVGGLRLGAQHRAGLAALPGVPSGVAARRALAGRGLVRRGSARQGRSGRLSAGAAPAERQGAPRLAADCGDVLPFRWPPECASFGPPPLLPARPRASRRAYRRGIISWRRVRSSGDTCGSWLIPWGFTIDPEIAVPPVWLGLAAWLALAALVAVLWRRKAGAVDPGRPGSAAGEFVCFSGRRSGCRPAHVPSAPGLRRGFRRGVRPLAACNLRCDRNPHGGFLRPHAGVGQATKRSGAKPSCERRTRCVPGSNWLATLPAPEALRTARLRALPGARRSQCRHGNRKGSAIRKGRPPRR